MPSSSCQRPRSARIASGWNDGQFSNSPDNDNPPFSQLGFLWLPILVAAIIGAIMLLVLIGLSFKKHKSAMLVVGSCSAAISAACHPPEDEDLDQATLGLLMWGETLGAPAWEMENFVDEIGEDRGRCSFTSLVSISFMPR